MQKPPDRNRPPILFSRASYEWINRISQKHKHLISLEPSDVERSDLTRWAETEFACSTLRLEGFDVSRDDVAKVAASVTDYMGLGEKELTVASLIESLRAVETLVRDYGSKARLTPDVLIRLRNPMGGTETFRQSMGDVTRPFKPTLPDLLPAAIENACRWFDAESFIELNPIEQAALVFLRLAEFQPFESASDRTSLVAASLFTMRRELPPVIIKPESQPQFRDALDEGLKMNTKPMIELMAAAVESSLDEMIGIVERKRKETKG